MRELEIKLTGVQMFGETVVHVDDKPVEAKKNEFGNLVYRYQTENDKVNVKVYRLLDIGKFGWFITQLFFFIISIFGLFDIHYKERCFVVDFEIEVDLKEENQLTLSFTSPQADVKAIKAETDLTIREVSNKYYIDTKAKKTMKALKITKIFLALAMIASAIAVLLTIFY